MKEGLKVKQPSTTTGAGDLTLGPAPAGFNAFGDQIKLKPAGAHSGPEYASYFAETVDGTEWEFGTAEVADIGTYGTLNRTGAGATVFKSSNTGALVSFTGDTTIRLITPENVRGLERGCVVTAPSSTALGNLNYINFTAEEQDTDNCWTVGDPDWIYIPLWASEVELSWEFSYFSTLATDDPIGIRIVPIDCRDPVQLYFGGFMSDTTAKIVNVCGLCKLMPDPLQVAGNPIADTNRAKFRFRIQNPDALSISSFDVIRLRMRILR